MMSGMTAPALLPEEADIASSIMLLYLTGGLAMGAALSFVRGINGVGVAARALG